MAALSQLEKSLEGVFKSAPKLPESGKKTLVEWFPWLALIFGVLQLLAAYWLWKLTRVVDVVNDLVNSLSRYYTDTSVGLSSSDKTLIYIGVVVLVIDAVIFLMAYPGLKARAKRGWDMLFLGAVINVAYSVLAIFINGRGIGSFLLGLLGSVVTFWLLFQIRSSYTGTAASAQIS